MSTIIQKEEWKEKKCGQCRFQTRAPRDPKQPVDLKAPIVLVCRWGPPNIVYAIGQAPNGQPVPMPLGAMFPIFDASHIACSRFENVLPKLNNTA